MKQTENCKLNLIETSDPFSPEPLNENARIVDELLHGRLMVTVGDYTGAGTAGPGTSCRIEFPFKPLMVVVTCTGAVNYGGCVWYRGMSFGMTAPQGTTTTAASLTWEDRAISWYCPYVASGYTSTQLNENGRKYAYIAFGVQE